MRIRVGNGCWHAGHILPAALTKEIGFFADEGLDVEIVHAKVYQKGIDATNPEGERYDEVGVVLQDMIAYNIDIIPDIHVRTPFAERSLGNDELRIIGGWRNQFRGAVMAAPGIESLDQLRGKTIGDWYKGSIAGLWWEHNLRGVGIDPSEVKWKVGYKYGSMREAWKPLSAGETDAAIVNNPYVPMMQERGFTKLYDFVEDTKPHGRPDRVTVARKSFIERNPEIVKRYWKASIRGYQYVRIAPEHYPFFRFVEAKLRSNNPDVNEMMRDLNPVELLEGRFYPMDGQVSTEGIWRILQEHISAGLLAASTTREDVEKVCDQRLVREAWDEVSQTEEVRNNLKRLAPVIERIGY